MSATYISTELCNIHNVYKIDPCRKSLLACLPCTVPCIWWKMRCCRQNNWENLITKYAYSTSIREFSHRSVRETASSWKKFNIYFLGAFVESSTQQSFADFVWTCRTRAPDAWTGFYDICYSFCDCTGQTSSSLASLQLRKSNAGLIETMTTARCRINFLFACSLVDK